MTDRPAEIARVRRVLDAMIYLLQDNPDIPIPWSLDMTIEADKTTFQAIVEKHGLTPYAENTQASFETLIDRLVPESDRDVFYLPWTLVLRKGESST